jgi:hypothetical protein
MPRMRNPALAAIVVLAAGLPAFAQDVLVVSPKDYVAQADAWKKHREAQGHKVAFREPGADVAATVKDAWEKSGKKLRFVLILGDVEQVACATVPRKATGQAAALDTDPNIATDAPYADTDGDGVPDLAIGRVPADTAAEAGAYLARAIAYETDQDFGEWRDKLDVVAGTGGFGPEVDLALEALSKQIISKKVPQSVDVTMTYARTLSPYCPPPAEFADYAVKRWNEGALVVAYVGHGSERNVDSVTDGPDRYPIFGLDQVARVAAQHGAPISAFVACSTGHFDGRRDCLAEELVKRPKGPVVVIASSRVSSPYSNGIVANEMLRALYVTRSATAGEMLVDLKRALAGDGSGDPTRQLIENIGQQMYEPDPAARRVDRLDHVNLYNLLGDPCLVIARPSDLTVAAAPASPGGTIRVTGTAPFDGTATVVLEKRRDAPFRPPITQKKTAEDYRTVYDAANSRRIASADAAVKAGEFACDVAVPADVPLGRYTIRVRLSGRSAAAAGACEAEVKAVETK